MDFFPEPQICYANFYERLLVIAIYGFAPGFLLRLIVLSYERNDPRREELIAELYTVPRLNRPFWVAEQIETAMFDALGPRIQWALTGRLILRWKLRSGVKQHQLYPTTFEIPSEDERQAVEPGDMVKLMFEQSDGWGERMWVCVEKARRRSLVGRLDNLPLDFPRLDYGSKVRFRREHIIDIDLDPVPPLCPDCVEDARARQLRPPGIDSVALPPIDGGHGVTAPILRLVCNQCTTPQTEPEADTGDDVAPDGRYVDLINQTLPGMGPTIDEVWADDALLALRATLMLLPATRSRCSHSGRTPPGSSRPRVSVPRWSRLALGGDVQEPRPPLIRSFSADVIERRGAGPAPARLPGVA